MSLVPDAMVMGPHPRAVSAAAPRNPPTVITYSFNSKLVYVTPGETYEARFCLSHRLTVASFCSPPRFQQAIDFAQEAFPELRDVDRGLICLEIRLSDQVEQETARICRMAWSPMVATLRQYGIVEIHVDSLPVPACSANKASVSQPPPYASEAGLSTDMKRAPTSEVPIDSSPSQQSHPCSVATRVLRLFGRRSTRHLDCSHSS